MKTNFLRFSSVIILALLSAILLNACKEQEPNEPSNDLQVKVNMSYSLSNDFDNIAEIAITYPLDNSYKTDTVKAGETWTKSLTYTTIPDTVGFVAMGMPYENVAEGISVSGTYSYKCEVFLESGQEVLSEKIVQEDNNTEFVTVGSEELSEQVSSLLDMLVMFRVTENEILQIENETIDDSDIAIPNQLPENDLDKVLANYPLYYLSSADISENPQCLHDNILARFPDKRQWNGLDMIGKGSFLYLTGADISSVNTETLKNCMSNGLICILDEISSFNELQNFCNATGCHNPVTETEASDLDESVLIIADSDVQLSSGENHYYGMFYVLSAKNHNGENLSDYEQGCIIDEAIESINNILDTTNYLGFRSEDAENELTKIVSAYKIFIADGGFQQSLSKNDYRSSKHANDSQSNTYSVEYDIWNVYSMSDKRNYYYIHQEILCNFANCYKGIYNANVSTDGCNTIAKVCEWYGKEVEITTEPKNGTNDDMQIHRNSPATTVESNSYTSGFSWNLGGTIGYQGGEKGGFSGSINGGISVNRSQTYSISDVQVSNKCEAARKLAWQFDMTDASANFKLFNTSCTNMHAGSLTGRSALSAGTDYIISFPENVTPILKSQLRVKLKSSAGKCGSICGERENKVYHEKEFALPYLKSSDFAKQ